MIGQVIRDYVFYHLGLEVGGSSGGVYSFKTGKPGETLQNYFSDSICGTRTLIIMF